MGFISALIFACAMKTIIERSIKKQDADRQVQVEVADQLSCNWNIKHSACFCSRPSFLDKYNVEHPEIITWVPERVCGI
jgi:hypothetical protein